MQTLPRISVVTSSYNQGAFIERTIESVLEQRYPNLEHIVVDGMSSDQTPEVLARYSHLRVIREPDHGQADAINKGFRLATGDIWCFLNSDDTFLPGALHRVAQEIDPDRGRHVVMGRCRFIDEYDRFLGVEHPSAFESHRRVLEIWKGYSIPQPAVFWTPEVWGRCGPLNVHERLLLDYDLFCRFSRDYQFYTIDQLVATYRLHTESKTSGVTDAQRLEQAIAVSRRYWGAPTSWQFWQIFGSYWQHRLNRRSRAAGLLRQGRDAWRRERRPAALATMAGGALLGPDIVTDVLLLPAIKPRVWQFLQGRATLARRLRRLPRPWRRREPSPHTLAWRDYTALHSDGWAGPALVMPIDVAPDHSALVLEGTAAVGRMPRPLEIELQLDGVTLARQRVAREANFSISAPLAGVTPGAHEVKIVSNTYAVPHDAMGNLDFRPLSFKLGQLRLIDGH